MSWRNQRPRWSAAQSRPEPEESPLSRPAKRQGPRSRVVVVGNGLVSGALCKRLVAADRGLHEIVVFAEEKLPAYDRAHLRDLLKGRPADSLALAPPSWYLASGIRLHLGDPVSSIDTQRRTVVSMQGHRLQYDQLVLATGAAPRVPPFQGDPQDIHLLRTVEDARHLQSSQSHARTAVVVGGGVLGVETAAALRETGLEVTIIEIGEHLMRRQLDRDSAQALQRLLERQGISVLTDRVLSTVTRDGGSKRLVLGGGQELRADIVVLATGVRPRDELGGADLQRHALGGYVVDEFLRTSDPHIFAIGDCAVVAGAPSGNVLPGYLMAEAVASTLIGEPRRFEPSVPSIRVKLPGGPLLVVGQCPSSGWTATFSSEDGYRALALEGNRLVAAVALGPWSEWNRIEETVVARQEVSDAQLRAFVRGDRLFTPLPMVSPSEDVIVCSCNLVTMRTVQAAIGEGCRSVAELATRTRVGTACGACIPVILAALTQPPGKVRVSDLLGREDVAISKMLFGLIGGVLGLSLAADTDSISTLLGFAVGFVGAVLLVLLIEIPALRSIAREFNDGRERTDP